ncbi:RagB/SusD family nutrient uptake outer membrane protein [Sunxiuqinia sp. A32]|uniref:RagB/SusD family nutrient uptake outer membrane protein n=1 Tax=Sunxiuqinia sp. A32 TaxID=3461496 RepID=UPI00404573E2
MKKIIYITCLIFLFSCSEDILDKKPLGIISDASVWNDPALIDSYITQLWADTYIFVNEVNNNRITNGVGWFQITYPIKVGGETRLNWGGNANKYRRGGLDINGGLFEWWENAYRINRRLNEFIERIPESPLDEATKKANIAEARFLRAFQYFSMAKRYGGVPLITEAQDIAAPEEELFLPRNKEEEIYNFVISEMDAIVNDLPQEKASVKYGKPTKYAALALKCRAALYAGSIAQYGTVQLNGVVGIDAGKANGFYQQSFDAASQIINSGQFALYNQDADKAMNFRNLFIDKNNSEVIFALIHDEVNSQQGGNGWGWDFIETPLPNGVAAGNGDGVYLEIVESFEYIDGRSGELDREAITEGLWTTEELWKDKDPRFFASVYTQDTPWKGTTLDFHNGILKADGTLQTTGSYEGILAMGTHQFSTGIGFGVLKMLDEAHDNTIGWGTSSTDFLVFRLGEILLNYAEAAYELNRPDDALNAVNQIRERAGIATLSSIDREKIRHERKVELLFENHRYWDLRRWRTAEVELSKNGSGLRYILDYNTGKFKLEIMEQVDGTVNQPLFLARHYYLPITLNRTANNPNLVENPGYE